MLQEGNTEDGGGANMEGRIWRGFLEQVLSELSHAVTIEHTLDFFGCKQEKSSLAKQKRNSLEGVLRQFGLYVVENPTQNG